VNFAVSKKENGQVKSYERESFINGLIKAGTG
jgi:hypothetical protein